jgi:hypothetical protein
LGWAVLDLRARAKSAWRTAERYTLWQARPELKKQYFEKIHEKKATALKRTLPPEKLESELAGLETEKDFLINESSAKYAYIWRKTAASYFCRPLNKWCELAQKDLAPAKEAWKAELRSKKIKFEDWMID